MHRRRAPACEAPAAARLTRFNHPPRPGNAHTPPLPPICAADVEYVNTFYVKVLHWRFSAGPLVALHNIDDHERVEEWHLEYAANFSEPGKVRLACQEARQGAARCNPSGPNV